MKENKKIRMVHVDDDEGQLEFVKRMVSGFKELDLVKSFNDPVEALNFINENEIDLLLLDVMMPNNDGLWLANQAKGNNLEIVFLTASPDYALKAFEACAIHYILKPITTDLIHQFIGRFQRVSKTVNNEINTVQVQKINELLKNYLQPDAKPEKLFIHNIHKTHVINLNELVHINAEGQYTIFTLVDKSKYTASKSIKTYVEALKGNKDFVRIHRGYIINKNFVKTIFKDKYKITCLMNNGDELEVSPQNREEIVKMLQ